MKRLRGSLCAGLLLFALAPSAHAQTDVRLSVDTLALLQTRALHGFQDSVELGAKGRALYGGTLEVGGWAKHFGLTWFSLSYLTAVGWNVTRIQKHGAASPQPLRSATAHLLVYRLPAPRARIQTGPLGVALQATLGARTGSVSGEGHVAATPIELMLPVRLSATWRPSPRWQADASAELLHSLATGAPSAVFGIGASWSLGRP